MTERFKLKVAAVEARADDSVVVMCTQDGRRRLDWETWTHVLFFSDVANAPHVGDSVQVTIEPSDAS